MLVLGVWVVRVVPHPSGLWLSGSLAWQAFPWGLLFSATWVLFPVASLLFSMGALVRAIRDSEFVSHRTLIWQAGLVIGVFASLRFYGQLLYSLSRRGSGCKIVPDVNGSLLIDGARYAHSGCFDASFADIALPATVLIVSVVVVVASVSRLHLATRQAAQLTQGGHSYV